MTNQRDIELLLNRLRVRCSYPNSMQSDHDDLRTVESLVSDNLELERLKVQIDENKSKRDF